MTRSMSNSHGSNGGVSGSFANGGPVPPSWRKDWELQTHNQAQPSTWNMP